MFAISMAVLSAVVLIVWMYAMITWTRELSDANGTRPFIRMSIGVSLVSSTMAGIYMISILLDPTFTPRGYVIGFASRAGSLLVWVLMHNMMSHVNAHVDGRHPGVSE